MGRGSVLPISPLRLQTLKEAAKCRQTRLLPSSEAVALSLGLSRFQVPGPFVGKRVCAGAHASSPVNSTPVDSGEGSRDALVLRPQFRDGGPPCSAEAEFILRVVTFLRPRGKRLSCAQEGSALNGSVCGSWGLGSSRFCKISPMI